MLNPYFPKSLSAGIFVALSLLIAPHFIFAQNQPNPDADPNTDSNPAKTEDTKNETENPYLCPPHWETDRLVDFVVSAEDKPRTIRRREQFVEAVCDAADRIMQNENAKHSWIRIAYLAKSKTIHYHACWGSDSSDKKLVDLIRHLTQIKNEAIGNDKRIKRNLEFLQLERALIDFKTESSKTKDNENTIALIEQAHGYCSQTKLTDQHLRLASNIIRVVNLLDPAPVESTTEDNKTDANSESEKLKWKTRRDKEYVRFGKLFEASPDLRMSRYGKKLATNNAETDQYVGQPLELKGSGLDDETIDVASLSGKIVIIDFWATWCGPCVAEVPKLVELYETFGDAGLEVIGVNLDNDIEDVRQFVKDKQINWPNIVGTDANKISEKYNVRSIPTMMLIDSTGKIIQISNGVNELKTMLKAQLESLPN